MAQTDPPTDAEPAAPEKKKVGNLAARFLTAFVVVPVLLLLLFVAPKWGFLILVYAASAVAAAELVGMTMPGHRLSQVWIVVASLGVMSILYFAPEARALATMALALVVVGFLVVLFAPDPIETAAARMAWTVAAPLYAGGMVATVAMLHRLDNGGGWVVLTMMLAWFSDTGGYFAGRFLGRHKLYPKVSPKKTIEGAVGGLFGSVGGALLAHFWYLPELPLLPGIGLAVVASALGQSGDLMISLVKRSAKVKDSGWIVPGHGGLLDRVDALVLTATATWVYVQWFG